MWRDGWQPRSLEKQEIGRSARNGQSDGPGSCWLNSSLPSCAKQGSGHGTAFHHQPPSQGNIWIVPGTVRPFQTLQVEYYLPISNLPSMFFSASRSF
jgi:hypothetical protein